MCRREAEGEGEAMKRGMDRIAGKKVCRGRKTGKGKWIRKAMDKRKASKEV